MSKFINTNLVDLESRRITLTNGRGAYSNALAEYALAGKDCSLSDTHTHTHKLFLSLTTLLYAQ
jgi:hypothetical protein